MHPKRSAAVWALWGAPHNLQVVTYFFNLFIYLKKYYYSICFLVVLVFSNLRVFFCILNFHFNQLTLQMNKKNTENKLCRYFYNCLPFYYLYIDFIHKIIVGDCDCNFVLCFFCVLYTNCGFFFFAALINCLIILVYFIKKMYIVPI